MLTVSIGNQKSGCTQAVYDKSASVCHLKGPASGLNWATSNQYTTIRFVAKPAIGSEVTSCPTTEQPVTTNGVTFAICANTDYQGQTETAIPQITSAQACAVECAKLPACANAVYSASSSQCFIKNPNGAQLRWTYDLSYTSVRVVSAPEQGSTLTSCPAGASSSIRSSKRVPFSACTNGDWHADSIDILGGVTSVQACADLCGPRTDCSFASYDAPSKACHIKPTNPAPVFVFNRGFTSLKRTNSPRRV
jgi:galactose oxidase